MTRASDTAKLLGAGATILDGTTISTADNTAQLTLTSTDADGTEGPILDLHRNSSSPADNDNIGNVKYFAENDAGEKIQYANIISYIGDASDGTEDGQLRIQTMNAGSNVNRISVDTAETVINDTSKDLDFRVESDGNANMLFVDGGNNVFGIGTNAPTGFVGIRTPAVNYSSGVFDKPHLALQAEGDPDNNDGFVGITYATSSSDNYGWSAGAERTSGGVGEFVLTYHSNSATGTERLRMDTSGRLLVGLSSASGSAGAVLQARGDGTSAAVFDRAISNGVVVGFKRNGGDDVGNISITTSNTAYNTSSDYRLKENVVTEWDATTRLKQLKPSRFNFIAEPDRTVDGFLAHEVSSIVPEAITGEKDAMTKEVLYVDGDEIPDGKKVGDVKEASKIAPQSIDQSKLVPLLVKTIQELEARITALESAQHGNGCNVILEHNPDYGCTTIRLGI